VHYAKKTLLFSKKELTLHKNVTKMDLQININEAQHRTLINIDINSAENVHYIVSLLRSLNFIKKVEVISEETIEQQNPTPSRFSRFYGAAKTGLSNEELEQKINAIRNEWERDI
jgi:hypothetical protein